MKYIVTMRGAAEVCAAADDVADALIRFVNACRNLRTVYTRPDGITEVSVPVLDLRDPLIEAVDQALR